MNIQEELDRQHFGETLSSLRSYVGLSQQELARSAGLPISKVARLEQGKQAPSPEIITKLERVIGCPLYFGKHQQVTVQVGDRKAEIDVGIAPLIRELWIADIDTWLSCQQNTKGRIWIEFASVFDIETFLNIVAQYQDGNDNLYRRMNPVRTNEGPLPDWEYRVFAHDLALNEEIIDDCVKYSYEPPADFHFSVSVRFPPQDLSVVLQRLKEHNAKVSRASKGKRP